MTHVPPRLAGLIASQGGLLTRAQSLDHGVEPRHRVRSGQWALVRTGVYAPADVWAAADEFRARPVLRVRAALLVMRRSCVVSHESAAFLHGLPVLDPGAALVDVTRPGLTKAFVKAGLKYHDAPYTPEQVGTVDGLRVLDLARTVADVARERGFDVGVVAADAALRLGVGRGAMVAAYEGMRSWPHVTTVRSVVDFADPGAETPLESLARILVTELGVGEVDTQFPVRTPRGVVWCDLRIGNHVFEADGRQKYLDARRGGLRTVGQEDYLWDEKLRERLLRDEGLGVSRVFWSDHGPGGRPQALRRLGADWADTVRRYGAELAPHLAHNAAAIRQEQPRVGAVGA